MQHTPMSRSLLCRDLIGREQELEQLRHALRQVASGNPQFVLISGEAGVGKTRLCRAFVQSNQVQSALRFWGRALPQDQVIPFAPFFDAFRRSLDTVLISLKQGDQADMSSFAFVAHLLPELVSHIPHTITLLPDQTRSPTKRQQLLFHDALRLFQALAQLHGQPIVLVLEDLHWADETSLELLSFLAHQLDVNRVQAEPSIPLFLLGTYRSEGLFDNPALQQMTRHLQAQRYIIDIPLKSLTASEHRLCVNAIIGQPVPEHFADFLFTWDEGNPLYAEELLESMAATGDLRMEPQGQDWFIAPESTPHLPSSITSAILERFAQLPDLDQEVLTYASVMGRTFDFPLLAAVCGVDEQAIVKVLSQALSRQLLSEVIRPRGVKPNQLVPSSYQFRHALIREALYDRLHSAERQLYHRTVAEALERLLSAPSAPILTRSISTDQMASLLAKHYQLACLPEQARPYAIQAAQKASALCAFREERYYLDLAQASLPEDSSEQLALLERLGLVTAGMYDFQEALRWLVLAQMGYERVGQPLHTLSVLVHMMIPQWFLAQSSLPALVSRIEAAVEQLLTLGEENSRHIQVLAAVGNLALYWGSHGYLRRASHWIEISEQLYAHINDPQKDDAFQNNVIARGNIKAHQQPVLAKEGIKDVCAAIQYAHQQSLLDVLMFGYVHLGIILLFRGELDRAEHLFEEAMRYEQRSGMLHPSFVRGWYHFFSGQWEEGIQVLRKNVERLEQTNIRMLSAVEGMVLAHILLGRNHFQEAQLLLQRTLPFFEPLQQQSFLLWAEWGFAKLFAAQKNLSEAQHWYERLLQHWRMTDDRILVPPMLLDGINFFVQAHHLKQAHKWLETLRGVVAVSGTSAGSTALSEAEGTIAAKEGAMQRAIPALRQAVEGWKALKWRYRQAEVSLQLAEVLLEWTRRSTINRPVRQQARDEAEKLLENAELLYEDLGVSPRVEQVQAMRSLTGITAQRKRRATLKERRSAQELTPKETQVLSLLVAGKTNKEIAEYLSITVGTVELHVTHILIKLRCETRTQAVAKAISQGLVTTPYDESHSP